MALATASSLVFATPALAQEAANAGVQQPSDSGSAGDIVVTGQKRAERLQDVPKQISVASQEQMQTAGVSRMTDLQIIFPTVAPADQTQNTKNPGIRGVATYATSIGVQSMTGIIVDDVPQATFSTLAYTLTDLERVEVFAGPQATLSGRNAAGGIINFVTKSPSRTPEYNLNLEQTTDHQSKVSAFLTGPLTDNLQYSLSLVYDKWDGNLRNKILDNRVGGYNTKVIRGKLRWEPTDRLTVNLTGYYLHTRRTLAPFTSGYAIVSGDSSAYSIFDASERTLGSLGIPIKAYSRDIYSEENSVAKNIDRGGVLRLDYDMDNVGTLSSITSYNYSTQPRTDVYIGYPRDNQTFSGNNYDAMTDVRSKYITQEVRLTSPSGKPFTYVAGLLYSHTSAASPYYRPGPWPVDWDRNYFIGSAAVFARGTYEFSAADSVTAGVRYQRDHQGYGWQFHAIPDGGVEDRYTHDASTYGFFGGEVSYRHNFNDRVNAYVTYVQSQTGQAYDVEDNTDAYAGTLGPLRSSSVRSYEIGLKSQLFDRALTFNIDAFWADYNHYQLQAAIPNLDNTTTPTVRVYAVGKVRVRGVELTTNLRVNNNLTLNFNGSYTDAEIRSYPGVQCYLDQTVAEGCVDGFQNNYGQQQLPFSSKWRWSAGADYSVPVGKVDLKAGAFVRYQSKQHYDVLGDPMSFQNGFAIVNLYAGPAASDGSWNIQFYVNNLFNRHYYAQLIHTSDYVTAEGLHPTITPFYDRASFRYGGVRASFKF